MLRTGTSLVHRDKPWLACVAAWWSGTELKSRDPRSRPFQTSTSRSKAVMISRNHSHKFSQTHSITLRSCCSHSSMDVHGTPYFVVSLPCIYKDLRQTRVF